MLLLLFYSQLASAILIINQIKLGDPQKRETRTLSTIYMCTCTLLLCT